MKDKLKITAFELIDAPLKIKAAERARDWMEASPDRFAYRCLPVALANQVGWDILCPVSFTAKWNGRSSLDAIKIDFHAERSELVSSHFGDGILTFTLGYIFRTTKSHNLWVKGPTNSPRDGIAPLEGLIETDWAPFSFTMNWKFTRSRHKVAFEKDEPICRIIPFPRHYITKFEPAIRKLHQDPKLHSQYVAWRDSRAGFIADLKDTDSSAAKEKWQRTYMKGQDTMGNVFAGHQTKVPTKEFKRA